jgi:hypothetical protein
MNSSKGLPTMRTNQLVEDIRSACHVHARLLDAFIALTTAEIERLPPGFTQESLRELLDHLRLDRRNYGCVAPLRAVETPLGNAA